MLQAADESLKRLGTDYIDIYYLHKEDHSTPLAETVRAMGELIREGKVRYFGVSNFRAWRVAEISHISDHFGIDRPVVSQPSYNAVNRMAEAEHFPAATWPRRHPLQPPRPRRAHRQIPPGCRARDTRAGRATSAC